MTDKLPFMPFYGVDFYENEAVNLMTLEEEATYIRLLWRQWREGSLPADAESLEKMVRGKPGVSPGSATATPGVVARFPVQSDGRRRNLRLEEVRLKHLGVREKQAEGGRRGRATQLKTKTSGRARGKPKVGPGQARGKLGHTDTDTDTEKTTWLTPYADEWSRRCGNPPYGKLASILAPLHKQHGTPETLARWSRYLDGTDPKFCSVHRFAETFNTWVEPDTKEETDTFGVMRTWRRDALGDWEPAA